MASDKKYTLEDVRQRRAKLVKKALDEYEKLMLDPDVLNPTYKQLADAKLTVETSFLELVEINNIIVEEAKNGV